MTDRRTFFQALFGAVAGMKLAPPIVAGLKITSPVAEAVPLAEAVPAANFWDLFQPGKLLRFEIPLPCDGSGIVPKVWERIGAGAYKSIHDLNFLSMSAPEFRREVIDVTTCYDTGFRTFAPGALECGIMETEFRPSGFDTSGISTIRLKLQPIFGGTDLFQSRGGQDTLTFEAEIKEAAFDHGDGCESRFSRFAG